jgi:hypothetical protein
MRNSKTLGLQSSCADKNRFIDKHRDRSLPGVVAAREAAAQS